MLMPRIAAAFRGGDDHLLSSIARLFEREGFRLLGAHEVAPEILVPEGTLGRVPASERDRADIALGFDYLRATGGFDVGQAVVVAGKHVLAVEAAEGTDDMLARVAQMRANGRVRAPARTGVLVKAPKPGQDQRFDLPSIGPQTVDGVAQRQTCRHCRGGGLDHYRQAGTADIGGRPRQYFRDWRARRDPAMSHAAAPHVFLVAGEDSGDRLGAALIAAIKRRSPNARFSGVGGVQMADLGVPSLFPLGDLAIIGFAAIPAGLPKIIKRIRDTADAVIAAKPDVLVIIDSPEFTHRVARRVRSRAPAIPIVDYVCPSVWAWRTGRARAMRSYVDHVLALLPFEPAVLRRLGGPPSTFVGHPLSESTARLRPNAEEARRRLADPPLLLVLPGSRASEIRRMAGIFGEAVALTAKRVGALEVVVPSVPRLADTVKAAVASWPVSARVVTEPREKDAAFRQARAALTKSGTSTLELGGRRRADGRCLQSAVAGRAGRPLAGHDPKHHSGQSRSRRERSAANSAAGLHARAPCRRAGAAIGRYAGTARSDRGLRPARYDHGDQPGRAERPGRRSGPGLCRRHEPTGARNSGIRPANSVVCLVQPDGLMPRP